MMLAMRALLSLGSCALAAAAVLPIMGAKMPNRVGPQPVSRAAEALIEASAIDPRRTVDAQLPPYSAVGKFKGSMVCTAAIVVHPRVIITAGHCITEKDGTIKTTNLLFRPGYQTGTDLGHFGAKVWAVGSKQNFKRQSVHDASQDWVILVLDRTPTGVEPFLLSNRSLATLKSREQDLLMLSYSNDIGDADVLNVDTTCSIRSLVWDVLVHDCRATFGSSGAPLLVRDQLRYALVGIHTGAMFASDGNGHIAKFIGNRAISSWMFTESLLALSHKLNREAPQEADSATY